MQISPTLTSALGVKTQQHPAICGPVPTSPPAQLLLLFFPSDHFLSNSSPSCVSVSRPDVPATVLFHVLFPWPGTLLRRLFAHLQEIAQGLRILPRPPGRLGAPFHDPTVAPPISAGVPQSQSWVLLPTGSRRAPAICHSHQPGQHSEGGDISLTVVLRRVTASDCDRPFKTGGQGKS